MGAISFRARWCVAEATAPGYQLLAFPSLWLIATGPAGISQLDGHRLSAYPCMVAEAVGLPPTCLPCMSNMCTIHTPLAQTQQASVQGSLLLHRALASPNLEPSRPGTPVHILNVVDQRITRQAPAFEQNKCASVARESGCSQRKQKKDQIAR